MIDFKRFFTMPNAHVTGSDESQYVAVKPFRGLNWGSIAVPAALKKWESEGGSLPPTVLAMAGHNNAEDTGTGASLNANAAISDALPLGVLISDVYGNCVYSNAAYERLSGRKQAHLLGSHWVSFIHPDDRDGLVRDWQESMRQLRPFISEARLVRTDGSFIWVRQTITVVNESRLEYGHAHILEDISVTREYAAVQRARQRELSDENARAQVTLDRIGDAVICTNLAGKIDYMNVKAEEMTGWSRADALNRPLESVFCLLDAVTRKPLKSQAVKALEQHGIVDNADSVLVHRHGSELNIENSAAPTYNHLDELTGAVVVFHDAKFSHERTNRNAHLAEHDSLTGLPNRVALNERFTQAQALARRHDKQMALLFIDLDNFKEINDQLGHESGDRLLISMASQLLACVRATDTVCRYGGDEFVILLSEIAHPDHAAEVAAKLHTAIARYGQHDGQAVELSLSIGISVFPNDGVTAGNLLKKADAAMYRAKAMGKKCTYTAARL